MLEIHDEQLRNMKERWNLLQTLRKEKRNQRLIGLAKSPEGEQIVVPAEHVHVVKRKKKGKNSVFRGYLPQHSKTVTFPLEPTTPGATAVTQELSNFQPQEERPEEGNPDDVGETCLPAIN